MASPLETVHPATRSLPEWSQSWCKVFTAFIAIRQKQADIRVAMYLRALSADSSEDSMHRPIWRRRFVKARGGQPGPTPCSQLEAGALR